MKTLHFTVSALFFIFKLLFLFAASFSIHAQSLPTSLIIDRYSVKDGLAGRNIQSIIQDAQGFLWVATHDNGFARYDGLGFKKFMHNPEDSTSLEENQLWGTYYLAPSDTTFWISTLNEGVGSFNPVMETYRPIQLIEDKFGIKGDKRLWHGEKDSQGRIWLSANGQGLFLYYPSKDSLADFTKLDITGEEVIVRSVGDVVEIDTNHFLFPTYGGGLLEFDFESGTTNRYLHEPDNPKSLSHNSIIKALLTSYGRVWLATFNGISIFDIDSKSFTNVIRKELPAIVASNNPAAMTFKVYEDSQKRIWAGTTKGLYVFDQNTLQYKYFQHDPANPYSLSSSYAFNIFEDKDHNIWLANAKGLDKIDAYKNQFGFINMSSINGQEYINRIEIQGSKNVYIQIWGGNTGWYEFIHSSNEVIPFRDKSKNGIEIFSLRRDNKGIIWVSTNQNIGQYNVQSGIVSFPVKFPKTFPGRMDYSVFFVDSSGNTWVSFGGGLFKWNPFEEKFKIFPNRGDAANAIFINYIRNILEDDEGYLWMSGTANGEGNPLYSLEPTQEKARAFLQIGDSLFLEGSYLLSYDSENQLWISAEEHLICATPKDGELSNVKTWTWKEVGLNNSIPAHALYEVGKGHYWIVSKEGLIRYEAVSGKFTPFSLPMVHEVIVTSAYNKDTDLIYLGCTDGVYYFNPKTIKSNTAIPPVKITDFRLFNQSVPIRGSFGDTMSWESPLEQSITYTDAIVLKHWQNDFSFEFAALNYTLSEKNNYQYRLVNYDEGWINTTADRAYATYTNIPPGEYTFKVIGSNNDDIWNEEGTSITLTILPPWYWAWWSKTLYILLLAGILYALYRFQLNRQLATAEARRLKELDSFKTKLYTNITHEFRTPLTVISGMADQVLDNPKKWFQEGLTMIKRNSQQLLSLVNQMLDLSKLEAGNLPVNLIQEDLVVYLNYLTESFHSYAETKDIRLHFLSEMDELMMDYDPEKVQTIFTNLVGNAIKFTPAGGDVYIKLRETKDNYCQIEIKDTGIGISEEQLPHIFDRFYQADDSVTRQAEGTGIGLALTKELVKLLDGTIEVQSQTGEGTTFTVRLPIHREAAIGKTSAPTSSLVSAIGTSAAMPSLAMSSEASELPVALLIEDNQDVLHYLAACLEGQYQLEMAANGQEGIEKALEAVPDIIISDVMMPKKDGFEVVQTLKNDERTSHIPIILLTAKADAASRIEGLERGADAYLAKPFEQKELEVRLRKLIELRQQLQTRYGALSPLSPTDNIAFAKEDKFLLKVRQLVEENIEDENYGIEELCQELRISRVQLHRKLKALTDKSTSHVIRSIRLQKAYPLLLESDLNITEIAYRVGFSSSKYFSQVFKEEFGQTPSDFRQQ